jgi:hypothetical protein
MWHVLGQGRCMQGFGWTPEGIRPIVRIILKWIFKKWDGEAWTGLITLRRRTDVWRLRMR